jgi:uncharacterized caspase-like protein
MAREADAANRIAVVLVTVLINFREIDETTRQHPDAIRIQDMIQDAISSNAASYDEILVAVAGLGARAVESVTALTGESTATWLQRWRTEPFGAL